MESREQKIFDLLVNQDDQLDSLLKLVSYQEMIDMILTIIVDGIPKDINFKEEKEKGDIQKCLIDKLIIVLNQCRSETITSQDLISKWFEDDGEPKELLELIYKVYEIQDTRMRGELYRLMNFINQNWPDKIDMKRIVDYAFRDVSGEIIEYLTRSIDYTKNIELIYHSLSSQLKSATDYEQETRVLAIAQMILESTINLPEDQLLQIDPFYLLSISELILNSQLLGEFPQSIEYYSMHITIFSENNQFTNNDCKKSISIILDLLKRKENENADTWSIYVVSLMLLNNICGKEKFGKIFYQLMLYTIKENGRPTRLINAFFHIFDRICPSYIGPYINYFLKLNKVKTIVSLLSSTETTVYYSNRLFPILDRGFISNKITDHVDDYVHGGRVEIFYNVLSIYIDNVGVRHQDTMDIFERFLTITLSFSHSNIVDRLIQLVGPQNMTNQQINLVFSNFLKSINNNSNDEYSINLVDISMACRSCNLILTILRENHHFKIDDDILQGSKSTILTIGNQLPKSFIPPYLLVLKLFNNNKDNKIKTNLLQKLDEKCLDLYQQWSTIIESSNWINFKNSSLNNDQQ
ncbi:hypothetical protein DFA_09484 [Cavenderia fasciculata]|uniref:Uncharacterized protein n=1 Tax=Cavenderia fasciculata TaxID=261658 RepID=F4Q7R5_CACFS|nr:uncharacterized protein DFA_09484 [Cavenderia fasciculata]EGG15815.1 hypothetical protein DFA_09484 [Cavenderia fasciculata]|eukprot:XP_004352140.1 hypothetical protein DFA_09484 [Cavenderia fasciculata]